jgi:hypothetical protein
MTLELGPAADVATISRGHIDPIAYWAMLDLSVARRDLRFCPASVSRRG